MQPTTQPSITSKRANFWLYGPASLFAAGIIVAMIGHSLPFDSAERKICNLLYLLIGGFGLLAFIPGIIYGLYLKKK